MSFVFAHLYVFCSTQDLSGGFHNNCHSENKTQQVLMLLFVSGSREVFDISGTTAGRGGKGRISKTSWGGGGGCESNSGGAPFCSSRNEPVDVIGYRDCWCEKFDVHGRCDRSVFRRLTNFVVQCYERSMLVDETGFLDRFAGIHERSMHF